MTDPAAALKQATLHVTKHWAKQRRAEERSASAAANREYRLCRSDRVTIRDAAFEVMKEAYLKASDGGRLPVRPRQIMYAARPMILRLTNVEKISSQYFSQTLLIDFMDEHDCSSWDVVWDARGTFEEPHTGISIPVGTLEVRQYLGERPSFTSADPFVGIGNYSKFETHGPENRYRTVLFVEKEDSLLC